MNDGPAQTSRVEELRARARGKAGPDALRLFEDALALMLSAGIEPASISTLTVDALVGLANGLATARSASTIPSLSMPGRHARLDEYVANAMGQTPGRILDIGCGCPPWPTIETGARFPATEVIGVDFRWPAFLLEDGAGLRAFFGEDRRLQYLFTDAALRVRSQAPDVLERSAVERFERLLRVLEAEGHDEARATIEADGARLTREPMHTYERENVRFVNGAIGSATVPKAAVIRCMNVMPYLGSARQTEALQWMGQNLEQGGLAIVGCNFAASTDQRYRVYRREGDWLAERELCFGVDWLRPVTAITWVALEGDVDPSAVASWTRVVRSDEVFAKRLDARFDALLSEHGLLERSPNGILEPIGSARGPNDLGRTMAAIATELDGEGYVASAASIIEASGTRARRNEIGDLAVATGGSLRLP